MRRFILTVLILLFFVPAPISAAEPTIKAGFIRDGDLWILLNDQEEQVTKTGQVISQPKWSHDGEWLLYQEKASAEFKEKGEQTEIWAYHIKTKDKKKIFYDGHSPRWAPNKNIIAFTANGSLNISNLDQFFNVAAGVSTYTWLPDGSGFLLSSRGVLRPDGWTSAMLFTKNIADDLEDIDILSNVDQFFTLPKEVGMNDNKVIAVNAGDFAFSPHSKWISFIVSPTASWAMDSNMLCVISSDGKEFNVLDEVVREVGEPKWAPSTDTIAFIAGGGRIVFGFKNKDLKVRELPASGSYTPTNYADLDFDWVTNHSIVTSRVKESEWSNDFSKHPLPALYSINIETNEQRQITHPPSGLGDYKPQYVDVIDKLVWLRRTSLVDDAGTLWRANADGSNAKEWLQNVESITFYEKAEQS
ncbi:hypothetical protein LGQ02_13820 [Bacillus shivajii]|uniref:TolB family protein n=1 Tax=Bacillus shivajii TaxID=1983719 RepID=UPI001CFC2253|nr:hypothetical protein [Bacillus shivajii]UCZ51928.1 hypothetical protein LGQ02_13820 [Bacillus shivajii]